MGQTQRLYARENAGSASRGKPIEAPREDQGVRDALSRCFGPEPMPDDFRTLLSRLR